MQDSNATDSAAVSRRLFTAIAAPVVILVVLGVVLGRQILQMTEDSRLVDHTDQVLSAASSALAKMSDKESLLRGFLITEDPSYLDRFDATDPTDDLARLQELTVDNPAQQARFANVKERFDDWLVLAHGIRAKDSIASAKQLDSMVERRRRMDSVRQAMATAVGVEDGLRKERLAASRTSTATTQVLFVVLLVLAAAAIGFISRRQLSQVASTFRRALEAEQRARLATDAESWIRIGQSKVADAMRGDRNVEQLGEACLQALATHTGAEVGAFFTRAPEGWRRRAGVGIDRSALREVFEESEGLVGRAAKSGEMIAVSDLPGDYFKLSSGTGAATPGEVVLFPSLLDGTPNAVVELGFMGKTSDRVKELCRRLGESVAYAVRSAEYRHQLRGLLEEAQNQAEELQTQQEELRVANEELEAQASALKRTQGQLEQQQAELEQTNLHLAEQSRLLSRQNQDLADKQAELAATAREVERASRFKSEFLSNMSHELRTPLNSSLILAKLLADNKDGNLSDEQVKYASTIYAAGNDLLGLINDILDLSKIEAGKIDIHPSPVPVDRVKATMLRLFEPVAKNKGLALDCVIEPGCPPVLQTDGQRLEQILKNLVSNALKFTERGGVTVAMCPLESQVKITVRDTGIGIPREHQRAIFEAFRQADGTTNRRYGGTGLGLSISLRLAHLLGGDLTVQSDPGRGSAFHLVIPTEYRGPVQRDLEPSPPPSPGPGTAPAQARAASPTPPPERDVPPRPEDATPDLPEAVEGGRALLVIEDDAAFADILKDVAQDAGFTAFVAQTAERGFAIAKKTKPTGIILDMKLPDHSGLSVLDRLKRDPATRHIPVHVISASDYAETALAMGAAAYMLKPVDRERLVEAIRALEARSQHRLRRVLVVDDDQTLRESVAKLLGRSDVEIHTAASAREALAHLRENTYDCVVTDLGLPDRSGFDLLETMSEEEPYSHPPIIVYTGRALTADEEQRLRKYSKSIIVKGARSPERLLDEVTLFLHQVEAELPPDQQRILKQARHREAVFEDRRILVVEDDVRNVFALTSVLEPKGARIEIARNGKEAIAALERNPDIDLVLMDVMMPEMDGLEATRAIRRDGRFAKLPIIALTAKAMKDDQDKCIAAGASDYLAKPLDVDMLLSLLRVWMPKT